MLALLIAASLYILPDGIPIDIPPEPDRYLYDAPSYSLDGGVLTVHDSSLVFFGGPRGVVLHRGISMMDMEWMALPYYPGGDIVWRLEPGTYEVFASSIDVRDERFWNRDARWTVVVPAPSRAERVAGAFARLIALQAEIRKLAPTDEEVWQALERVTLP